MADAAFKIFAVHCTLGMVVVRSSTYILCVGERYQFSLMNMLGFSSVYAYPIHPVVKKHKRENLRRS